MGSSALSDIASVFPALFGLLLISGVIGAAVALMRALLNPGDPQRTSAAASHFLQICGLCAAIGAIGLIATWLLGTVGTAGLGRFVGFLSDI